MGREVTVSKERKTLFNAWCWTIGLMLWVANIIMAILNDASALRLVVLGVIVLVWLVVAAYHWTQWAEGGL
jgi:hypothetical protein